MKNSVLICSVSPEGYTVRRNSYAYSLHIPPCEKGQKFSTASVEDQMDYKIIYHGLTENEIERIPFPVSAGSIVKDIFQTEEFEAKGVFVPAGEVPTDKELSDARKKRRAQLVKWMNEGDILFAKHGIRGVQFIPDYSKRAVTELGEKRDWVFDETAIKTECPICGELLRSLSNGLPPAICKACGSILDPARVASHSPEPKRKPGRPKRDASAETLTA